MLSLVRHTNNIELPMFNGHISMVPFNLATLEGLTEELKVLATKMLSGITHNGGTAFFTMHGRQLVKGETLRRPGAHTDGSYDKELLSWGGGGWKVGENGPQENSSLHNRLYNSTRGGIILCSNYEACLGYVGEVNGLPSVGGDCSKLDLPDPFLLERNKVYYGNNHFIHESLPMAEDVHRVFARITLPEDHVYS